MTEDDPTEIRRLLATTGAGEGPPMGLRAEEIAARGTRIRRLRKRIAIAASAGTTVGVAVLVVFFTGGAATPAPPAPVMPAGPGLTIETPSSSVPETPEQSGVPEPSESSVKIPSPTPGALPSKPQISAPPAAMPSSKQPQAPSSQPGIPAPPSTKPSG
ncbi:hypothetical protein ACPZ19_03280 [Amycolatopsis lurida]